MSVPGMDPPPSEADWIHQIEGLIEELSLIHI